MMPNDEKSSSVLGIWATIAAGFDLTTKHLWLLIIPTILDTFLWLGPRLGVERLVNEMLVTLQAAEMPLGELLTPISEMAPNINLFTAFSVPLLGVPVMMAGVSPETTPVLPLMIELASYEQWLLYFLGFSLVGLFLGAMYFRQVASVVARFIENEANGLIENRWWKRILQTWLQFCGAVIFLVLIAIVIYLPIVIVSAFLSLFAGGLGIGILLLGPMFITWFIFYSFFVPHGLTLNFRSFGQAFLDSFRLVRRFLIPTLLLILVVILFGTFLDWILVIADSGTWLTAVSILAHAFISTSFVASTFVFYRQRYTLIYPQLDMSDPTNIREQRPD